MTAPDDPRDFWNRTYESRESTQITDDELVGAAALSHFGPVEGKHLLDLGCGLGEYTLFFAERGAQVTALDSSTTATERLRGVAEDAGLQERVTPVAVDAFDIARLGPFDLVFGSMILHHLEPFAEFVRALRGALAAGGRAFFYENSARSKSLIWLRDHVAGRYGVPKFGDSEEFPLEPREIDELGRIFNVEIAIPELFLARLGAIYLLNGRGYPVATRVDQALYRIEPLRKYSYRQMVLLS